MHTGPQPGSPRRSAGIARGPESTCAHARKAARGSRPLPGDASTSPGSQAPGSRRTITCSQAVATSGAPQEATDPGAQPFWETGPSASGRAGATFMRPLRGTAPPEANFCARSGCPIFALAALGVLRDCLALEARGAGVFSAGCHAGALHSGLKCTLGLSVKETSLTVLHLQRERRASGLSPEYKLVYTMFVLSFCHPTALWCLLERSLHSQLESRFSGLLPRGHL